MMIKSRLVLGFSPNPNVTQGASNVTTHVLAKLSLLSQATPLKIESRLYQVSS
ncbi:hypothetical protein PIB30_106637, partial [Stylosanthes scabra]|nr:hypothetical protein [Stylosanthes scabra]